ncbi:PapG chaperone-binding domain-containing protein [Aeromonas veronii]|uniref:PapG chaperone-binding domain-containing protein n=1 Tax=Aeromonas veronii TaxID=654 RepID=UPI002B482AC5|nr:PapG chaperone-binding domain-containing protein [Aeromonas veronii]
MRALLYILMFFSMSAQAAVYATKVYMHTGNYPEITWLSTESTAASGDLYAMGYKYFGLASRMVRFSNGNPVASPNYIAMIPNASVALAPGDTWQQAVQKFINQYGQAGSIKSSSNITTYYVYEACVAVAKCNNCGSQGAENIIYPGSCVSINFANNACSIDSQGLIDHGSLNISEVNGHTAKISANISCDMPALIRLRVVNSTAYLGNGINSDLYIDGAATGNTSSPLQYNVSSSRAIEISSILSASSPQPGTFSGSSLVLVDVL